MKSSSRARPRRRGAYDSNRYLLTELLERLGAVVTDLGILADERGRLSEAAPGGRGPRSGAHVRRRFDRRSRSCARARSKDRQAGVLARRDQAGPAGRNGCDPGRRRAQRRLRRPARQSGRGIRDLRARGAAVVAAACGAPAGRSCRCRCGPPSPTGRRKAAANMCAWRSGDRGWEVEAFKHPQDGAGVITSLTRNRRAAEISEDVTKIEPGATVGFLSYAAFDQLISRASAPKRTAFFVVKALSTGSWIRVEPYGANHGNNDSDHAGYDEALHSIGSSPGPTQVWDEPRRRSRTVCGPLQVCCNAMRSARAASSGVFTLKNGSTGWSGHLASAMPCRAVQTSILRKSSSTSACANPRAESPATDRRPDDASRRIAHRPAACPRICAARHAAARRDRRAETGSRPAR